MGRTVPTQRQTLESILRNWQAFRRALRGKDREAFDRLLDRARQHTSASSYAALSDPVEGVLLSILLEQEKEIERLREELKER